MSYSNRFSASLAARSKQPSTTNSRNPSTNSIATTSSSNINNSKSRSNVNKAPPGLPKSPKSKSPVPIASRKRASSLNPQKISSPPPFSPSDDFTTALILRKKDPVVKNSVTLKGKDASAIFPAMVGRVGNLQKSASVAAAKDVIMHEGPIVIPEENFNFYRLLARPSVWNENEQDNHIKSDLGCNLTKLASSPSYLVKTKESEIWGSMGTSSPAESTIPSLTCILGEEKKVEEELEPELKDKLQRDENNNMLQSFKKHIFGSMSFFDHLDNATVKDETVKQNVQKMKSQVSVGRDGQAGDLKGTQINAESYLNSAHKAAAAKALFSETPVVQNSVQIPPEIEKQLHKTFYLNRSCHEHHPLSEYWSTSVQRNEDSSEHIPSLTEISDSGQLVLDNKNEDIEEFHDVSSRTSITSKVSCATETMPDPDEMDSQQTQTQVEHQDAETDTESVKDSNKRKMMKLAMAVNTGVDITPEPQVRKKKSVRISEVIKSARSRPTTPTTTAVNAATALSLSSLAEETFRKQVIQERQLPQTYTQMGADYGFPSRISLSSFIGNLVPAEWASIEELSEAGQKETEKDSSADTKSLVLEKNDGTSFINTAYDLFNAGLKFATSLIGDETELEPREDTMCYNGYKIRVFGRKLLLESLHVNCDFTIDANSICRNHSNISLKPHTLSRESLEQSCEGRRVRVVVRMTGPSAHQAEEASSIMELEHNVHFTEGKWTFLFGSGETGENFIEILCPTGVHPESLAYGLVDSLLFVDAP